MVLHRRPQSSGNSSLVRSAPMQPHALTDPGLMQLSDVVQHTLAAHAHRLKASTCPSLTFTTFPVLSFSSTPLSSVRAVLRLFALHGALVRCITACCHAVHGCLRFPLEGNLRSTSCGPSPPRQPCVLLFPNPALPANSCAGFKVSCTWRLGAQPEWVA